LRWRSIADSGSGRCPSCKLVIGLWHCGQFSGLLIADISLWFSNKRRGHCRGDCGQRKLLVQGDLGRCCCSGVLADHGWRAVYMVACGCHRGGGHPLSLFLRAPGSGLRRAPIFRPASPRRAPHPAGFSPRMLMWLLEAWQGSVAVSPCRFCHRSISWPIAWFWVTARQVGGRDAWSLMLMGGVVRALISGHAADKLGVVMTLLIGSCAWQCLPAFSICLQAAGFAL